jgi:hypothetical protein
MIDSDRWTISRICREEKIGKDGKWVIERGGERRKEKRGGERMRKEDGG